MPDAECPLPVVQQEVSKYSATRAAHASPERKKCNKTKLCSRFEKNNKKKRDANKTPLQATHTIIHPTYARVHVPVYMDGYGISCPAQPQGTRQVQTQ
jgi:tRNA G10  N-methylase Trm11